jgi:myo-inositol 2-dehydrogenase/D-chiro-inositol 1-dehydrogenase
VFCEKPIDLDMGRVEACGEVVRVNRTAFFVGFNRRFDPSHRALYDAIRAGEIGRPEMLVVTSRDPEISPPDYVAAMPYGIFYDTMIHDFDMVRWLLSDDPVEILARTA